MFVYSIKNEFFTKYDPYWICRLLAFKASSAAIVLCLWNAFFFAPDSPGLYFMSTMIGVIATEMLPAYTKKQQLIVFWKLVMMVSITIILFGFFSYFNFIQLIGVTVLTYIYFRVLAKDAQTAVVPAILIMFGIVGTQSGNTDFNTAINSMLFYIEFGLVGSLAVLLFPNFRDKTFKSAFLRLLQQDLVGAEKGNFTNHNQGILNDLSFMKVQLPHLNPAYSALYASVISYQLALAKEVGRGLKASSSLALALRSLFDAVSNEAMIDTTNTKGAIAEISDANSIPSISKLIDDWNRVCKA